MDKVYTDKTETTPKANDTIAYPVHSSLLRFLKELQQYLNEDSNTLTGLLSVSSSVPQRYWTVKEKADLGLENG